MKFPELIAVIGDRADGAKNSPCDFRTVDSFGHGKNLFPDLRGEMQHAHNLSYPDTGDPLLKGDGDLAGDLSGFQEIFPLDSFSEEFDDSGGSSVPGAVWGCLGRVGPRVAPDPAVPVASGCRCYRFRTPLWARGRSRRPVRGRGPRGRNFVQFLRHGRSGSRSRARRPQGRFAICYIWGSSAKIDLTYYWLNFFV